MVSRYSRRIVARRSWVGNDPNNVVDACGHGTHVIRMLLATSVFADIMVAKVSESKSFQESSSHNIKSVSRYTSVELTINLIYYTRLLNGPSKREHILSRSHWDFVILMLKLKQRWTKQSGAQMEIPLQDYYSQRPGTGV